jgi:hypothetical protein
MPNIRVFTNFVSFHNATKEVGLEMNPDTTKHILISRRQNMGQKAQHNDSEQVL